MKHLNLSIAGVLVFIFSSLQLPAQKQAVDTAQCLEFIGKFDGTVKDLNGEYIAQLIKDNKVIKELTQTVTSSFRFIMKKNMAYTVKLVKQDYISKTVSINTTLPKKLEIENLYIFNLQTNLLSKEIESQFKDDDIDFPIALVSYGKKCDCFEYNQAYTTKLINNMYTNLLFGY